MLKVDHLLTAYCIQPVAPSRLPQAITYIMYYLTSCPKNLKYVLLVLSVFLFNDLFTLCQLEFFSCGKAMKTGAEARRCTVVVHLWCLLLERQAVGQCISSVI